MKFPVFVLISSTLVLLLSLVSNFSVAINGDDDVDEDGLIDEMIFLGILNSMQAMPRPPSLGNFSQPLLLLHRTES